MQSSRLQHRNLTNPKADSLGGDPGSLGVQTPEDLTNECPVMVGHKAFGGRAPPEPVRKLTRSPRAPSLI